MLLLVNVRTQNEASHQRRTRHSLERVGAARRDLPAGGALPDSGHQTLDRVLAAEGARVLGVLGDLRNRGSDE